MTCSSCDTIYHVWGKMVLNVAIAGAIKGAMTSRYIQSWHPQYMCHQTRTVQNSEISWSSGNSYVNVIRAVHQAIHRTNMHRENRHQYLCHTSYRRQCGCTVLHVMPTAPHRISPTAGTKLKYLHATRIKMKALRALYEQCDSNLIHKGSQARAQTRICMSSWAQA